MARARAQTKIVLLDCCYSGAFSRSLPIKDGGQVNASEELGGIGRVIITASNAIQYSFEGRTPQGDANQSVFTKHLVVGLETGAADLDGDGRIAVDELYRYVHDQVVLENAQQRPSISIETQGTVIVATSRAGIRASVLPGDLLSALTNPLPRVRLGAVDHLADLLHGADHRMTMAARVALGPLVDDDSRLVADAARKLLVGDVDPAPFPISTPIPIPAPSPSPVPQRRKSPLRDGAARNPTPPAGGEEPVLTERGGLHLAGRLGTAIVAVASLLLILSLENVTWYRECACSTEFEGASTGSDGTGSGPAATAMLSALLVIATAGLAALLGRLAGTRPRSRRLQWLLRVDRRVMVSGVGLMSAMVIVRAMQNDPSVASYRGRGVALWLVALAVVGAILVALRERAEGSTTPKRLRRTGRRRPEPSGGGQPIEAEFDRASQWPNFLPSERPMLARYEESAMATASMRLTLRVELDGDGSAEELEVAVQSLQSDLDEAAVDVERVASTVPPPDGSKAALGILGDVLLLAGQGVTADVLGQLLIDWVQRRRQHQPTTLRIEGPGGQSLVLPEAVPADVARTLAEWTQGPDASSS